MLLYPHPHFGNQPLCRRAQKLDQRVRGHCLNQHGHAHNCRNRSQQILPVLLYDIVDKELGRARQHEACRTIDESQKEPGYKQSSARPHQVLKVPPDVRGFKLGFRSILGKMFHFYAASSYGYIKVQPKGIATKRHKEAHKAFLQLHASLCAFLWLFPFFVNATV